MKKKYKQTLSPNGKKSFRPVVAVFTGNAEARKVPRVDLLHNEDDFQCVLLASLGFSNKYIEDRTGLSFGRIAYRLGKGGVKRADYRNGESAVAKALLKQSQGIVETTLQKQLRKRMKELYSER